MALHPWKQAFSMRQSFLTQGPAFAWALQRLRISASILVFHLSGLCKAEQMKMEEFWVIQLDFMHRWPSHFSSVLSELVADVQHVKKHFQIKEGNILNVG